ncbi:LacI family DNA-binding transcriptional regulator [Thermoactinomyces daqus]|uniref:LacI family DNA-binding transcriptional regulator n=1 Tax=Thermoactinomyces daqus TaxID=1329516 RepID=A0A7W1X7Z4_9BACL|nr:LacI family DNA-binding transcriptional regulator [Thermoactinomyces daqus]MBA4541659.1 LacI family DNA-binding transcriptional regulator [Thermoactinomyces daqus]
MENKRQKKQSDRATISDVARLAGVSKTTISRYLSGKYHMLSDSTLNRIEKVIAELNYRPNKMARGLKRDRSYLIGMVIADITNPFSTAILRGAEDVCKQRGYSLMVCNTDNDPAKEREYIFMLQSHRIDGLIINTTGRNNKFLQELATEKTAVVLVDRKVPELGFDTVTLDNEQAMAAGVNHLLARGYKHIALFSESIAGVSSREERVRTFQNMLSDREVSAEVHEIDLRELREFSLLLDEFFQKAPKGKRAVFAANGVILLKTIHLIQEKGIEIGKDVAVLGFDDMEWAPLIGPGITTLAQPTYEMGVTAMKRVLERIDGDRSPAQNIAFSGQLLVRGSAPEVRD